jgi:hypothetical protein
MKYAIVKYQEFFLKGRLSACGKFLFEPKKGGVYLSLLDYDCKVICKFKTKKELLDYNNSSKRW